MRRRCCGARGSLHITRRNMRNAHDRPVTRKPHPGPTRLHAFVLNSVLVASRTCTGRIDVEGSEISMASRSRGQRPTHIIRVERAHILQQPVLLSAHDREQAAAVNMSRKDETYAVT